MFHNYAEEPAKGMDLVRQAQGFLQAEYPWLHAGILKTRKGSSQEERRGVLLLGEKPDRKIQEHGVWYASDLMMNRDASFYLDTRNLRYTTIADAVTGDELPAGTPIALPAHSGRWLRCAM